MDVYGYPFGTYTTAVSYILHVDTRTVYFPELRSDGIILDLLILRESSTEIMAKIIDIVHIGVSHCRIYCLQLAAGPLNANFNWTSLRTTFI
jgi:hypothetical protein